MTRTSKTLEAAEPVAIVGMSSRLPGAPDLAAFWELLLHGRDGITGELPDHLRHHDWSRVRAKVGQESDRLGGFLENVADFDAEFFGLSHREVTRLSPAHRLLFESVWEAVEDSGTPAEALAGTTTALYTSCLLTPDYWNLLVEHGKNDLYAVVGSAMYSTAAGLVARALDLRGPTMALDAACASSLLAVHMACASIRSGESEAAIVGTVNLQLGTDHTAGMARVLSRNGACMFGDSGADGYLRSDGALAVLLKPLGRAVADGDRVYATILGSGATGTGRESSSIVAPSPSAQAAAIRAACAQAGLRPSDIDYVEAHGAGTARGDEAELTALRDTVGPARAAHRPCLVGSVKSNVGHTEGAAGLTGLVKAALAVWHGVIPPTLHVRNQNPVLAGEALPLRLVRTVQPWPEHGRQRLAGVSSFGMSGMNVHMVLAGTPAPQPRVSAGRPGPVVLPISARTPDALAQLAAAYARRLDSMDQHEELRDIAFSVGARRTHHQYRIAVVGADRGELAESLRRYAAGDRPRSVLEGHVDGADTEPPRVVFVFPGQQLPWVGMGRELLRTSAVFRRRLLDCDATIHAGLGFSVLDRLSGNKPLAGLQETEPVLWAVALGIAAVWCDWGLQPDHVIGYGSGELAAATFTGRMTGRDALDRLRERGELLRRIAVTGQPMCEHLMSSLIDFPAHGGSTPVPAVRAALAGGQRSLFVEISPHPLLTPMIETVIESAGADGCAIGSLHSGEPDIGAMVTNLGRAYVHGCTPDWARLNPGGRYVTLPTYAWQRKRYWVDTEPETERPQAGDPGHSAAPSRRGSAAVATPPTANLLRRLGTLALTSVGRRG